MKIDTWYETPEGMAALCTDIDPDHDVVWLKRGSTQWSVDRAIADRAMKPLEFPHSEFYKPEHLALLLIDCPTHCWAAAVRWLDMSAIHAGFIQCALMGQASLVDFKDGEPYFQMSEMSADYLAAEFMGVGI